MIHDKEERGDWIDSFRHGGKYYEHVIFCSTDDRVECRDSSTKETIIIYTANTIVLRGDTKEQIGHFNMFGDQRWRYTDLTVGFVMEFGRDLLRAEVDVSKHYLQLWQDQADAAAPQPVSQTN